MFRIQAPYGSGARAIEQPDIECANLNSGDAFLVISAGGEHVFLWLGQGANEHEQQMGQKLLSIFSTSVVHTLKEFEETDEFWTALGGKTEYSNVKDTGMALGFEPRLFQASNAHGYFFVQEIYNFGQEDLVNDDIMLLDAYQTVFVWIGNRSNDFEKRGAFKTAHSYVQAIKDERDKDSVHIVEVDAGKEPTAFTNHFSQWKNEVAQKWLDQDPTKAIKGNMLRGLTLKVEEAKVEASKYLDPSTNKFPYEDLKGAFPEGVDPTRREAYLSDEDFKKIFGVTQGQFYELKKWKQQEMRKTKELF